MERKLSAIVAADVVGYSRLMQQDDRATLQTLTEYRAIFSDRAAAHRGRIVNAPGDSILAEFPAAAQALEAGFEIQAAVAERNRGLDEARRMEFRIGVSVGEVLVDSTGALYGDCVNMAARLEALAYAGGICLSAAVFDHVKGHPGARFEDLGQQRVKNFAAPVHAYRVGGLGRPAASRGATERLSIAVLPFDNLSNDPQQEHFCDGICEDMITDLGRIHGMMVMARQSSFAFKGKANDLREVGRKLNVRYLVEGSVRTVGERIRVNAQLIEAESGAHVWAQRYDYRLDDVFMVGDQITEEIVTALDVQLAHGEQARIWRKALRQPKAREAFYRGMSLYYAGMPPEMAKARELFHEVMALEPDSAWGYAQTAATHCLEAIHGWSADRAASLRAAHDLGRKAMALDATVPSSHAALGVVDLYAERHDDALARLQRAYDLRPMCSAPRAILGMAQMYAGDWEGAVRNAQGAVELNPLFPLWYHYLMGAAQHFGGQHDAAVEVLAKVRAANPRLVPARLALVAAQVARGRAEEAAAEAESIKKDRPDLSVGRFVASQPFRDKARRQDYLDALRTAGLPA